MTSTFAPLSRNAQASVAPPTPAPTIAMSHSITARPLTSTTPGAPLANTPSDTTSRPFAFVDRFEHGPAGDRVANPLHWNAHLLDREIQVVHRAMPAGEDDGVDVIDRVLEPSFGEGDRRVGHRRDRGEWMWCDRRCEYPGHELVLCEGTELRSDIRQWSDQVYIVPALGQLQGQADRLPGSAGGALISFHDAFTIAHAGTGIELHGTTGSLIGRDLLMPDPVGEVVLRRKDDLEAVSVPERWPLYENAIARFDAAVRRRRLAARERP